MAFAQAKHEKEILALRKMIKKALFFRESGSFTPLSNPNTSSKLALLVDLYTKSTKRWNQANLGYFDPYLNKVYGESEIVSVRKDVYYKNIMLFI